MVEHPTAVKVVSGCGREPDYREGVFGLWKSTRLQRRRFRFVVEHPTAETVVSGCGRAPDCRDGGFSLW